MEESEGTFLPDIVIAGAPKCGTSSLFFWLAAHPDICGSRKKETHFLRDRIDRHNEDLNIHEHGLQAYKEQFRHCNERKLKLEATPNYFYDRTPIQVLSKGSPPPWILFILREPSEQIHSSYRFSRYRRKRNRSEFRTFIDPEQSELRWAVPPLEKCRYAKYLTPWVEAFGRAGVYVYLFERMKKDPKSFMQKVAMDLGIDPDFYGHYSFEKRNSSKRIKSKWLHQLGERIQPHIPNRVQEKLLPLYLKLNAGAAPPVSEEEIQLKKELRERFLGERDALRELFPDLDLTPWENADQR